MIPSAGSSAADPADAERWQRLKAIVGEALERPETERAAYLEAACGGDEALRREVASLLEHESPSEDFLDQPLVLGADPAVPLPEGSRLGPWRVQSLLGSGGMGEVYLAQRADGSFEQRVAIKVIRTGGLLGGELLERFLAERRLLAELQHPHIAHLLDGGSLEDGRPYLVMEHVEGEPIDRYCEHRDLPVEARLRLFLQVCDAVQHAHRHLVVHRDLKPANVLVTDEGIPKLLDFGVAKDLGAGGKTPATRLLVPVTPEYASPEQLTGGPVTTAVDVYALGVVLYELLAGQRPFSGEDPLAGRSRADPPSRPSTRLRRGGGREARRLRRRLTGDLDHIVLRALEPEPVRRYPSVEQLARDLERHLRGLPLESRGGVLYRLGKLARRRWKELAAATVILALAAGWGLEMLERRQAEREQQHLSNELVKRMIELFIETDPARDGDREETLRAALDSAAGWLAHPESFDEEPRVRASLLGAVGQAHRRVDQPANAEPLLRECLSLRLELYPPDHELVGIARNNLALALRSLGRYAEARSQLWETRSIQSQNRSADQVEVMQLLNNLAGVEKELGNFEEALALYREALAMRRRLPRGNVVTGLRNLGAGLRAAGQLEEAEAVLREALGELSRQDRPSPLARAGIEHHLGGLLRQRGDLAGARPLLERTFAVRDRERHVAHRSRLATLLELALVDQAEGELDRAEQRLREVVELRRQHLGNEHPDLAGALVPLARLLAERGEAAAAVAAAEEAVAILRRRLPAGHWRIVEAEGLLAELRR